MKRSSPKPSGKKLYSTAEDVLKFYGSPTICKKEVPLRSVVSSTGSSPLHEKTQRACTVSIPESSIQFLIILL